MYKLLLLAALVAVASASTPCTGYATYKVTMEQVWSGATTVRDYPSNAHWSPLAGASHVGDIYLARQGTKATPGVRTVAETGNPSKLGDELNALKDERLVKDIAVATGGAVFGQEEQTIELVLDPKRDFVSAVSMMAPSPDWFASIRMILCDRTRGEWIQTSRRPGNLFDAGSDSGSTFTSRDAPTDPKGVITHITEETGDRTYPFYRPGSPIPAQTLFRFQLLSVVTPAPPTEPMTTKAPKPTKAPKAPKPTAAPKSSERSVKYVLKNNVKCDFSAFYGLIQEYKLYNLVEGDRVTVFAPKTGAIQDVVNTIKKLAKQEADDKIVKDFVRAHVVKGYNVNVKDYEKVDEFTSAEGTSIKIKDAITVKSSGVTAKVAKRAGAKNGVVYCINDAFEKLRKDVNRRRNSRRGGEERRRRRSSRRGEEERRRRSRRSRRGDEERRRRRRSRRDATTRAPRRRRN